MNTNFNTLKNRFYIENYSSKNRQGIEQDVYSQFLRYNIFHFQRLILDRIIKRKKERNGIYDEYKVDQSNLIRNLNSKLLKILFATSHKTKVITIKKFMKSCLRSPNKIKKVKYPPRNKKLRRKFNIQYSIP